MTSISKLVINAFLNAKTNEVKYKIHNITSLPPNTAYTALENKTPDHSKYITIPEFNNLTAESFTTRLKETNLATKGDDTLNDTTLTAEAQILFKSAL